MVVFKLIPQPTDQRNVSQGDILNNMSYLVTSVGTDHNFTSNTATSQDGYHTVIHQVNQGGTYGDNTPASTAGQGQLYTKTVNGSEHLCYHQGTSSSAANEACLSVFPVRAAVNFDNTGAIKGTSFNCTVTKTGVGNYTVNFTVSLPSNNYCVLSNAMPNAGGRLDASLLSNATYGNSATTTFAKIQIIDTSNYSDAFSSVSVVVMGG